MIVLWQGQIFIIIFIIITLYRKHQRRTRGAQILLFCPPVVSLQMTVAHEKDAKLIIVSLFHSDKNYSLRNPRFIL